MVTMPFLGPGIAPLTAIRLFSASIDIKMNEYKTKTVVDMLKAVNPDGAKALIVMPEVNSFVVKSAANIPGVKTALVNTISFLFTVKR